MNEMVALARDRDQSDLRPYFRSIPATRAWRFWTSVRGTLIHRAKYVRIYPEQDGRTCVSMWCGNTVLQAIPFKVECSAGKQTCRRCEDAWRKNLMTADTKLEE